MGGQWQWVNSVTWTDLTSINNGSSLWVHASTSVPFLPAADFNGTSAVLLGLANQGIASINRAADGRSVQQNGNVVQAFSTYTTTDGATHEVADVDFAVSQPANVFSLQNGANFDWSAVANAAVTHIDMASDTAANTLKLSLSDVLGVNATAGVHKLTVSAGANDTVDVDFSEWTSSGTTVTEGGHTYAVYNGNASVAAQLLIEEALAFGVFV